MRMYIWESEMMANHRSGQIAVIASSLEEAKSKASTLAKTYLNGLLDMMWLSEESYAKKWLLLQKDLSRSPEVCDDGLLIPGSE